MVIKKRGGVISAVTRVEKYISELSESELTLMVNRTMLQGQMDLVKSMKEKYAGLQQQLVAEMSDDELIDQELEAQTAFFQRCDNIVSKIGQILEALPEDVKFPEPSKPSTSSSSSSGELLEMMKLMLAHSDRQNELQNQRLQELFSAQNGNGGRIQPIINPSVTKLPHLNTPTFDGRFAEWYSFRDRFTSSISNHPSLSDVQKLEYLQSALKGYASSLVKNLPTTEANYTVAWEILTDHFEIKNEILADHIRTFYDLPHMNTLNTQSLQRIYQTMSETIMAVDTMGYKSRDPWLIQFVLDRLDSESKVLWGRECKDKDPDLNQFREFLNQRRRDAKNQSQSAAKPSQTPAKPSSSDRSTPKRQISALHNSTGSSNCRCCQEQFHPLYKCPKFLEQNPTERYETVRNLSLCRNCLGPHLTNSCTFHKCRRCQAKHNILLHDKFAEFTTPKNPPSNTNPTQDTTTKEVPPSAKKTDPIPPFAFAASTSPTCGITSTSSKVFLATAIVDILTKDNTKIPCRILLDGGAQVSIMTTALYQKLKLPKLQSDISILGVGNQPTPVRHHVQATIFSQMTGDPFLVDCYIMPKITGSIPNWPVNENDFQIPSDIEMADPNWANPQPVDLLICGDVYWASFLNRTIQLGPGLPHLRETVFGYVIVGEHRPPANDIRLVCHNQATALDDILRRFWEVEEFPIEPPLTDEQRLAEEHFVKTHKRTIEGRFQVQLPFKEDPKCLGDSRPLAIRQFLAVERKFDKNPTLKTLYSEVIHDYLKKGWIEPVPSDRLSSVSYYMPHHGVLKDSLTTKLRVVYNASAATTTGLSLNDLLLTGPTVQPELLIILLRFRRFQYAMTADISKMYLQLVMDPKDVDYQRLVWRDNRNEPIRDFRITRVCFGVASSPFLATRALIELANLHETTHPHAAAALRESFYVDDGILSIPSLAQALQTQSELMEVLNSAGFVLTKWSANHSSLIPKIDTESKPEDVQVTDSVIGALGVNWDYRTDTFQYTSPIEPLDNPLTMRKLASSIAKLFDPMGLIGPVVIEAKMLLQETHKLKLKWDDVLPNEIVLKWKVLTDKLIFLKDVQIPRWISTIPDPSRVEIHAFCDASLRAYGTAIYIVTYNTSGKISSRLLLAKCRVSPIKPLTIPRLELCGALLAADTVSKFQDLYKPNAVHFWTDSTIVLYWLNSPPEVYKIFVTHRVRKILQLSTVDQWRHVSTSENSADLISRGCSPQALAGCHLWWNGPKWLSDSSASWPPPFIPSSHVTEEARCLVVSTRDNDQGESLLDHLLSRCSSLPKILRIVAYCTRFGKKLRALRDNCPSDNPSGPISACEIEHSLLQLIHLDQQNHFHEFISHLKKANRIPFKWRFLLSLNPFLDDSNTLRVGGRIQRSQEDFDVKHPILLPKSKLTVMIARREHVKQLHAPPTLLLATLRQKYWPLSGRNITRTVYHECYTCFRAKPIPTEQIMGDLPFSRVNFTRPFHSTGVDFAGPVSMLSAATRGVRSRRTGSQKAYIAIFICMATKACHLEIVTSLSTEAFLACLRRFSARRLTPKYIFSDCGKNFQGASNELTKLLSQELSQREIVSSTNEEGIVWKFNPPLSPHHGGIWEACVKSTKYHLQRITNSSPLSYEELTTILCQIESVLNSRPICTLSSDPCDLNFLTPGHFLVGAPGNAPPDPGVTHIPGNRQSAWQTCQARAQEFAHRWRLHYLNTLQQRSKWRVTKENLAPDQVVLLLDETNREGSKWILGKIESTHPGADGYVRVVTVRTVKGVYKRPVTKIACLPTTDGDPAPATREQPGEDVPAVSDSKMSNSAQSLTAAHSSNSRFTRISCSSQTGLF